MFIEDGYLQPLGWMIKCDMHSPDIQLYTEQVVGKDGEYYFGSNYGARLITLELTSPWVSKDTKQDEYDKLIDVFRSNVIIEREGLYFSGRVESEIDVINLPHYIVATVPLKLFEPFLWDEEGLTETGVLINKGNIPTYPVIEFHNSTNPSIGIGGSTLSYRGTCDSLVIDCERRTVKDNGVNVIHNFGGQFAKIEAGQIVNVTGTSFKLTWKNRYL